MTNGKTRGQVVAADVSALLRARNPLIVIVTREEARVEALLIEAAAAAGYIPRTWDVAQGFMDLGGKQANDLRDTQDPGGALTIIGNRASGGRERGVWIMRDLSPWLEGNVGFTTVRQLRNLARSLPGAPRDRIVRAQKPDQRRRRGESDDERQARHRAPVAQQDAKLPAIHTGPSDRSPHREGRPPGSRSRT